ncbi:hypothetical protein [Sphingomonas sp. CFBP 8760]|uniref:hypothetical protein n=1 Tax=Sphingomonas sp. CFBP 8760 TaxID=2775282 RepID=UPI00177F3C7C|nr:hypothetical protein [Sphingomonas sp. CFBP 8760]MBD8546070.1 hypothetical protein [Sphingomonas sp. CFBP 8760]
MGKRTIAGVLKWATAIVVGITAFVAAIIGLGEQISKFRIAVFGNAAAADAKDGYETVLFDDTPPLDNAFQSIEAPTPEPIVTPSNDPNNYRVGDEIYNMEPVTFTVKPPDETKEPIMTPPCSCVRRDDQAQKVEVFNACSANAKIILMKYPHYPLESFQPLPV